MSGATTEAPSRQALRTAALLAAIDAGRTAPAIAAEFDITSEGVRMCARRHGRTIARCTGRPAARSGVAVTEAGLAAMHDFERAHGLPAAVQP